MANTLHWNDAAAPHAANNPLKSLLAKFIGWRRRRAYRLDLARLAETSPHLLSDIGIDPRAVTVDATHRNALH